MDDAPADDPAPAQAPPRSRSGPGPRPSRWRATLLDLAPVLVAAVAVAAPLIHVARTAAATPGTFWLGADAPEMELRTLAAARGHLALGSFSVYGWQHPGPSLYYWSAPFYVALGREPAGMIVAAIVANVAGLAGLVALVGRCAGRRAAWLAGLGVVAFLWRFGVTGLWVSWNPNLTVVPMALLIVATAAVLAGHRWVVPLVVLLGSWTVQAHLGTAIVVTGLWVLAAVCGWRASREFHRTWRRPLLAGAVVASVLWAPALVDQFNGSGNMSTVLGYMVQGDTGPNAPVWSAHPETAFPPWEAAKEVGLVGSLLSSNETGRFIGPDRAYAHGVLNRGTLALAFIALVAANAAGAWWTRRRRGRGFGAALGGTVALAGVLTFVSAASARGNPSHHAIAFAAGVGLAAWIGLALLAVEAVADRRPEPAPDQRPIRWPVQWPLRRPDWWPVQWRLRWPVRRPLRWPDRRPGQAPDRRSVQRPLRWPDWWPVQWRLRWPVRRPLRWPDRRPERAPIRWPLRGSERWAALRWTQRYARHGSGWSGRGSGAVTAVAACLVVAVAVVPLTQRPAVLIGVDTPEVAAIAEAVAPRPGERIVVGGDRVTEGLLLQSVLALAVDGHDVRVTEEWQVFVTPEQAMPETWDRSIYLDVPRGPRIGPGWRELGSVRDGAGRELRVLARPGPSPFPTYPQGP